MLRLPAPLITALRGKGPVTLLKRVGTIGKRYGLTAAKMDRSLEQLSRILQQFDCRATLPVTTVALARNSAVIQKYQAQGIEFAVHGYRHIDYSQLTLEEQLTHFRQAGQIFQKHGIHFEGFRAPYLRGSEHTLTALSQAEFSYDSSPSLVWDVPEKHTTDSYHQVLGFYGAQPAADYAALPYLDAVNNLVLIPYCLPDDESLIERLRWHSPVEMNQVWSSIFDQIHQRGELFTLGLHPERMADCTNALVATLEKARAVAPTVWYARLTEIAAWWKARYTTTVDVSAIQENILQLTVNGPQGTTLLLRSLEAKTTTRPWFDGYQRAVEMPCILRTPKRPFIGVSPGTHPNLTSFLKQQGYVPETTTDQDLYSFYLDRVSFSHQEERSLIAQIENADFPLVRLGRWPNGVRSAMTITGDIDALTLWDYGLRFLGR